MEKKGIAWSVPKDTVEASCRLTTNKWLSSNLKGETEGPLEAAQDQAINTIKYQKMICDQQLKRKGRMCSQHEQKVDHIVTGCEVLAKTEYISKQNKAAAYLHWGISKDHAVKVTDKWYKHKPKAVLCNKDNSITIMWDMPVYTDRNKTVNTPDIIIKDSVNSTSKLTDVTIPSDRNIALNEVEKKSKNSP